MQVTLRRIAHTRSGDKGNTSNIAVIAYEPDFYPVIERALTVAAMRGIYPEQAVRGAITRYAVEGLGVLNFVLEGALGGGVSRSLAIDNYGKALASAVLRFELEVPDAWAPRLRGPGLAAEE
ncbi:hypothetical protein CAL29_10615 [Bordetella genomosp. 10]|uniref:AtuA-like ferredoxin-fold domain-containing protein n=1 Tax=Bordetella genomosp. 10 TaxID=1416804 RepID=A0A261SA19_9BORD|nr:hypothetical protein [Bordetella genomosp. 10]OZI34005.1 hypothetical protein CAL29_10615 [Bordetella genomosp. 10]